MDPTKGESRTRAFSLRAAAATAFLLFALLTAPLLFACTSCAYEPVQDDSYYDGGEVGAVTEREQLIPHSVKIAGIIAVGGTAVILLCEAVRMNRRKRGGNE